MNIFVTAHAALWKICVSLLVCTTACNAAYTDIKIGKVRNWHLLTAIALFLLLTLALHGEKPLLFSKYKASNMALSMIMAVLFFHWDIWAPGDSKLFIVLVLMLPMDRYQASARNIFPALNIIVWSFTTGYLYLLLDSLRNGRKRLQSPTQRQSVVAEKKRFPGERIKIRSILSQEHIAPFVFGMGISYLLSAFGWRFLPEFWEANRMIGTLAILGIGYSFKSIPFYPMMGVGVAAFALSQLVLPLYRHAVEFWCSLLQSMGGGWRLSITIAQIAANNYENIPGKDVRPGMILSFFTLIRTKACMDPNLPKQTTETRRSRITEKQAVALREWSRNAKEDITVMRIVPFAPFIALGTLYEIARSIFFQ
jgi:Flp pilus assembly protein protease CpaA